MTDFIQTFSLFWQTYAATLLLGVLLAPLGVFVLSRDAIFVGFAASHGGVLGVALIFAVATFLGVESSWFDAHHEVPTLAAALTSALIVFILLGENQSSKSLSRDGRNGLVYLGAASATLVLLSQTPRALDHVIQLLNSSVIGVTTNDVVVLTLFVVLFWSLLLKNLRSWTAYCIDREQLAIREGRIKQTDFLLSILIGIAIGYGVHIGGLLLVFGALILPVTIAHRVCRRAASLFFVAPSIYLAVTAGALLLGYVIDAPPGQITVLLLTLAFGCVWLAKRMVRV